MRAIREELVTISAEPIFIINSDEPYDVNRTTGEMIVKRITSIMYCHEY